MSAEITPEIVKEAVEGVFREIALDGGLFMHRVIAYLHHEVERLQQERDAAIDERNAWRSGDQDSRIEADRLRGEVQRLTEEARRSDAGRVEVPDCSEARRIGAWACFLIYDVLLRPDLVAKLPWSIRSDDLPRLLEDAKQGERLLSAIPAPAQNTVEVPERRWTGGYPDLAPHPRLSPSPQPATEAVLTCDDCDSREGCPKRGTPCMYHMSHSDHQPSADVVVVPREEWEIIKEILKVSEICANDGGTDLKCCMQTDDHHIPLARLRALRSSANHDAQDAGEGR